MDARAIAPDGKSTSLIERGCRFPGQLWRRISLVGVTGLEDQEARRIKLTNQVTVLISITTLCFNALYVAYDFKGLAPAIFFNLFCIAIYSLVLVSNHKRHYFPAKMLMCGMANLHLFVLCGMLGPVSGLNLFYFVPVYSLIFRPSEKLPLYGFPVLAVMLYLATRFLFPDAPGFLTPDSTLLDISHLSSVTGVFLLISMIITLFSRDVLRAERLLASEYKRSESLLLNVLPQAVVNRLKEGESTIADRLPGVTVVFVDIVGFTNMASTQAPAQLVANLGRFFECLDSLVAACGLEKIKTIGDAYMAVSGAPEPRDDHADCAANFALDVRNTMKQWTDEQGNHLEVRIGLHSGPVTAGIIGSRKFAYDIWGDTVNIASRMESHGVPGQIHVSETSRNLMGDRFGFEDRGWVDIKGKGRMRTFFLTDRRPSVPAALAPPVWHEF